MSLLKSIGRLKTMDDLIRKEITGNAEEFANKVGIRRSMMMENLREMKELGAEIHYCSKRRSYFYARDFSFVLGHEGKKKIRGGNNVLPNEIYFGQSSAIGHHSDIFVLGEAENLKKSRQRKKFLLVFDLQN